MDQKPPTSHYVLVLAPFIAAVALAALVDTVQLPGQLSVTGEVTATGNLLVDTKPQGASVYVDGALEGSTPMLVEQLTTGNHKLRLTKAGYKNFTTNVFIYANRTTRVNVTLSQAFARNQTNATNRTSGAVSQASASSSSANTTRNMTGSLRIFTKPSGANVYVDKILRGITPITISNLSAGSHSVLLRKSGYNDYARNLTISAGKIIILNVTLLTNRTY